jgi:glycopeptide antibiotics resistance protein
LECLITLSGDIPKSVYVGLALMFGLGTVLLLIVLGQKKGIRWSAMLLLLEYVVLLILMSALMRAEQADRMYNFSPFWSYRMIRNGSYDLLPQIIANVVAFFPIGFLLGCIFRKIKWWRVMLLGGALSALIEILQFVLKRGFTEFDDVFHNVLGCMLGYGVSVAVVYLIKNLSSSRV